MSIGLLILRVVVGLTLAAHGAQKLLGWFGGHGLAGTGGFFEKLGFHPGRLHAFTAGLVEAGGGLLLALGLLTPLASAGIVAVMLVAVATVHARNGFFVTAKGFEYNLLIATVATSLAFTGPGRFAVDTALGLGLSGWQWGVAALAVGVAGGLGNLALRSRAPAVNAG